MNINNIVNRSDIFNLLKKYNIKSEEEIESLAKEVYNRDSECTECNNDTNNKDKNLLIKLKDKNDDSDKNDITSDDLHLVCSDHKDTKFTEEDSNNKEDEEFDLDLSNDSNDNDKKDDDNDSNDSFKLDSNSNENNEEFDLDLSNDSNDNDKKDDNNSNDSNDNDSVESLDLDNNDEDVFKDIDITFDDIGGLSEQKEKLDELITCPYKSKEEGSVGKSPTGIVIDGESGTGKSMLAKAVANKTDSSLFELNVSDVLDRNTTKDEIKRILRKAKNRQPSIVLIENIDLITKDRDKSYNNKSLARLESEMARIDNKDRLVVIGTTSNLQNIDDSILRNGLFSYNIHVDIPDYEDKKEIINIKLDNYDIDIKDDHIDDLIDLSTGFVGADIDEAFASAERKSIKYNKDIDFDLLEDSFLNIQKSVVDDENYNNNKTDITFDDIGGLNEEISKIRKQIKEPLEKPEIYENRLANLPNGVLFTGPPGTGKTMMAKAVANEVKSSFYLINGPEIMNKYVGGSEKRIREIFERARNNTPSIIFIDEIDAIASERDNDNTGVVTQLLTEMDGLDDNNELIVIGSTNKPDSLDNAIRRGGRFDLEIKFDIPDKDERYEIINKYLDDVPTSSDINVEEIVDVTNGYVGADINNLIREADYNAIDDNKEEIEQKHIIEASNNIEPSSLREYSIDVPDVTFDDIGGLDDKLDTIKKSIINPIEYSDLYDEMDMDSSTGIILHGPPGTGKTMIAKAVANESNSNFISIKGPEIYDKYMGESEKRIRKIFNKARSNAPSIVFIDELDAIAKKRGSSTNNDMNDRIVNQLLSEMQGLESDKSSEIVVMGTTNKIENIDDALRRSGRFDKEIKIDNPDEEEREDIYKLLLNNEDNITDDINISKLSKESKNMNGADIKEVINRSKQNKINNIILNNDDINNINKDNIQLDEENILNAIDEVKSNSKDTNNGSAYM